MHDSRVTLTSVNTAAHRAQHMHGSRVTLTSVNTAAHWAQHMHGSYSTNMRSATYHVENTKIWTIMFNGINFKLDNVSYHPLKMYMYINVYYHQKLNIIYS